MKPWLPAILYPIAVVAALLIGYGFLQISWDRPPLQSTQDGFRGTGMEQITNLRRYLAEPGDDLPAPIPPVPPGGPKASEIYQNVPLLGDLSSAEFLRLMTAITAWVSPKEGCNYCHEPGNLASDAKYAKVVSRRMIEMTQSINENWKAHVANTGVSCYTCHRGNPVPKNVWFADPEADTIAGQNFAAEEVGLTSLPADPYSGFFGKEDPNTIRVVSTTALPEGNRANIKQTEYTYGLMITMSQALGVNCTFCHNTRSFASWKQSSPRRNLAWQGIQMVRNVNMSYIQPLKSVLPPERLGPHGQVPQVACATCHQGAKKPLMGANLVETFPELQTVAKAAAADAEPVNTEAATDAAPMDAPDAQDGASDTDAADDASDGASDTDAEPADATGAQDGATDTDAAPANGADASDGAGNGAGDASSGSPDANAQ